MVQYLHLYITFHHTVFCEAAIFPVDRVDAMRKSCDTITRLEIFGDLGTDLYDSAHIVTSNCTSFALLRQCRGMDVLPVDAIESAFGNCMCSMGSIPVSWVECHRADLDQDVVVT